MRFGITTSPMNSASQPMIEVWTTAGADVGIVDFAAPDSRTALAEIATRLAALA